MEKKNTRFILTKEAWEKLKKEYQQLVTEKRKEVAEKIKMAREEGDISDSAMYESARKEQAFVEGRIEELEQLLKRAEIVEKAVGKAEEVEIGRKVRAHIEGNEEEFHLVPAPEADPVAKKISVESPIGQALLGKKVGDEVSVETPLGKVTYKILAIE